MLVTALARNFSEENNPVSYPETVANLCTYTLVYVHKHRLSYMYISSTSCYIEKQLDFELGFFFFTMTENHLNVVA